MTVYDFAKKLMSNEEFARGGIIKNERKYLDAIGFQYTVADGCIVESGEDLHVFYDAMYTLQMLNRKYAEQ